MHLHTHGPVNAHIHAYDWEFNLFVLTGKPVQVEIDINEPEPGNTILKLHQVSLRPAMTHKNACVPGL
jgi:hypothetical protein